MKLKNVFVIGTLVFSSALALAQGDVPQKSGDPKVEEQRAALKEFITASGIPNPHTYAYGRESADSPISRHRLEPDQAYTEAQRKEIHSKAGERSDINATFFRQVTGGWGATAEIPPHLLVGDEAAKKVARDKWTQLYQLWEKAGQPSRAQIVSAAAEGTLDPSQVGRLAADTDTASVAGRAVGLKKMADEEMRSEITPEQRATREQSVKNMEDLLGSYFSWIKDRPSGGLDVETFGTRTDKKFASVYNEMARCTSDSCAESELVSWLKKEMPRPGYNDTISSFLSENDRFRSWAVRLGAVIAESKAEDAEFNRKREYEQAARYRQELTGAHAQR